MSHQKHAKISRPALGNFHRNEWAILGTTCGKIKELANGVIAGLAEDWKIAYVDADHKSADEAAAQNTKSDALDYGARRVYTDKISHHQFNWKGVFDKHQYRAQFADQDAVLINGNHFQATRQIVVIDPVKEKSLKKRLDQIKQIDLLLFADPQTPIFPFLKNQFPEIDRVPSANLSDIGAVTDKIKNALEEALPPLYGLVLAGGKSQRMGQDKGAMEYHGKPQREYMADLLNDICEQVYVSVRPEQNIESNHHQLSDTFLGLGPLGGLLSAFREKPDAAWLVVACDLPLLDKAAIEELVAARNPSSIATAFNSPVNEFPEPLIAIWEPRAYRVGLAFLAQGYSCPRKVLINSEVSLIDAQRPETLMNVNRPEESEKVRKRLQQKSKNAV
ncbi:MAG TPA: NTP transferase domain-containing protein [Saprospiraceae bacterium]|nr:NTP transferase domain-containing protein [Saprospiraceae bacterium]